MTLDTFRDTLVKKCLGNDLVNLEFINFPLLLGERGEDDSWNIHRQYTIYELTMTYISINQCISFKLTNIPCSKLLFYNTGNQNTHHHDSTNNEHNVCRV